MADFTTINGLSNGQTVVRSPQSQPPLFQPPTSTAWVRSNLRAIQAINRLVYPDDVPKYYIQLGISEYKRSSATRIAIINPTHHIILPLPLQLIDNHSVEYEQTPLGKMGATALSAAAGASRALDNSSGKTQQSQGQPNVSNPNWFANQLRNIAGAVTGGLSGGNTDLTKGVVGAAGSLLGENTGELGDALLRGWQGYSPNQFLTILLKGPMYKRNEFTWKLAPRNPNEAKTINMIVRLLNNSMAPALTGGGFLFSFPKVFTVSLIPNSQYLFKMKPCVLENMTVNYTAGGRNAFLRADGESDNLNAPESVEIRARFLELEYWIAGDFIQDNDPSNVSGPGWDQ